MPITEEEASLSQGVDSDRESHHTIKRKPVKSNTATDGRTSMIHHTKLNQSDSFDEVTENKQAKHDPLHEFFKNIFYYAWIIEIISCVLACIAFAAIVISVAVHQDRPLPQWPQLISINSLIAIFTAILKASILMPVAEAISQHKWRLFTKPRPLIDLDRIDSASRGPWGSFLLLLTARRPHLVFFGALIPIIALAIDPFSQQLIRYYSCIEPVDGIIASIPRTSEYTEAGAHVWAGQNELDSVMVASIYQGLLSPPKNASSGIPFSCETGNCTFPVSLGASYSSLGMCYSCRDVNSTVFNATDKKKGGGWIWKTESGAQIGLATLLSTSSNATASDNPDAREAFTFDTLMLRSDGPNQTYWPWAFRCGFYPCIKTYSANISRSVLEENITATLPLPYDDRDGSYRLINETGLSSEGKWNDCWPSKTSDADHPRIVDTYIEDFYPPGCAWSYPGYAIRSFSSYMGTHIFGNGSIESAYAMWGTAQGDPGLLALAHKGTANLKTVETFMTGLTDSITTTMRTGGPNGTSVYARGTTISAQTCVGVRWPWLALPGTLLVVAIVFLGFTIVQTATAREEEGELRVPWKSSSLALVMHSFGDGTRERLGKVDRLVEMDQAANRMTAQLVQTDTGWRLVER